MSTDTAMPHESLASPCISVCVLDEADVCLGCYRDADEITRWGLASDDEKKQILSRVKQRQLASQSVDFK